MPISARVVADRFEFEAPIGEGGMGQVFRALDRLTGRRVAVKVMRVDDPRSPQTARFLEESLVLAELSHEGIVAHVAHGVTAEGQPFLVMELLEGEDLEARLGRGLLSTGEAVRLARQVARALDAAHRRGIVHRDLKPSNLFLRDGEIGRVAVLDFGLARRPSAHALTRTGVLVGTPLYMSPEQAQASRGVGPASDVFSLGCVLYHALVGHPPFAAEHLVATLAKIIFEEPRPIESARADVPAEVRGLVAAMLAKKPDERPRDAGALLARLDALEVSDDGGGAAPRVSLGLGVRELELVGVLLVAPPRAAATDATLDAGASGVDPSAELQRELRARGLASERLADGSIVSTITHRGGSAVDLALEAALAAHLARARWPEALVAVATARGVAGEGLPLGEALDRASALLAGPAEASGVRFDEVTRGLLGGRLRASVDGSTTGSLDGRPVLDELRPLLGKPTPCVGREQELGMLELTLTASLEESESRAVLVVGLPGLGKSRLRRELLRRIEPRGDEIRRLEGRGEPLRAGSPHGLIGQALRGFLGLPDRGDAADVRARLEEAVAAHLPEGEAQACAEMIGELCDVPFPDEQSVRLRTARQDPKLMQAFLGEALVALVRGVSQGAGVLVLLEDLHWGDRPSLELVGRLLRELHDRPLVVVALARPEIRELAPDLWKGRAVELPLRPLGRKACERLIERVAGDRLDRATIARIVEQCDGNALLLEELVRTACDGEPSIERAPPTVMAMLQARIGRLEAGERRALRAASVYGERFSSEGVMAVVGPAVRDDVPRWLEALSLEEMIEAPGASGREHRFRHALMREAAYALLTDDDRRLGHRLAAGWLSGHEHDPALIAEHLLLADAPDEAGPWFLRAAQRAHDRDDYATTARLARRATESGARGESLGGLAALTASCAVMTWDWDAASAAVDQALGLLRGGSWHWCLALRVASQLAAFRNDRARLVSLVETLLGHDPSPEAWLVHTDSALYMASSCTQVGLLASARSLLAHVGTKSDELPRYPNLLAWRNVIRSTYQRHGDDDLAAQLELLRESLRLYAEAGNTGVVVIFVQDALGEVECRSGQAATGEARIRRALADAERLGAGLGLAHARLALANSLLAREEPAVRAEAEGLALAILATAGISAGYQAMARDALAHAHLASGDLDAAAREARAAITLSPHTPVRRWLMVAHLTLALTRSGRPAEALEGAQAALAEVAAEGSGGYAELPLLLAAAEAARDAGDPALARSLADRARARCDRQLASFDDEARQGLALHLARATASFFPLLAAP